MLLPRAVLLMTRAWCACSDVDVSPPCPQISWEAPVEKKAECIQKGKSNQVGPPVTCWRAGGCMMHASFRSIPVVVWGPALCSRHSD